MAVPDEQAPAGRLARAGHVVDADHLVGAGRLARSLPEGSGNRCSCGAG